MDLNRTSIRLLVAGLLILSIGANAFFLSFWLDNRQSNGFIRVSPILEVILTPHQNYVLYEATIHREDVRNYNITHVDIIFPGVIDADISESTSALDSIGNLNTYVRLYPRENDSVYDLYQSLFNDLISIENQIYQGDTILLSFFTGALAERSE